jgi:hypothetical protein
LSYPAAAEKLAWLMTRARMVQVTGVVLKEDAPNVATPSLATPALELGLEPQKQLDSGADKLRSSEQ